MVGVKRRLRIVDCRLGVKCRLRINADCRPRVKYKLQTAVFLPESC